MKYSVKEIYYTLQGEGANTGRPAVFLRFTGCNLWTGREKDRPSAICRFCDTDFLGTNGLNGGEYPTCTDLVGVVNSCWLNNSYAISNKFVVCTGGEPSLQVDEDIIKAFHQQGFEIAIETNGTNPLPDGIDWVCVSPKAGVPCVLLHGNELKLVYPQIGINPEQYTALAFDHFYLQPMDGPSLKANTMLAVQYCAEHPQWKLSIQSHKLIGLR